MDECQPLADGRATAAQEAPGFDAGSASTTFVDRLRNAAVSESQAAGYVGAQYLKGNLEVIPGRVLHTSTFQLNVSAFRCIRDAHGGHLEGD